MPIDYLHSFPELAAIGREQLQAYCDEWVRRPIARSFGIAQAFVDDDLLLSIHLDARTPIRIDTVVIHVDEILGYIVDRHFADASERRRSHARIRQFVLTGRRAEQRCDVIRGRRGRLYLTCKSCGVEMETAHEGIEGQTVDCPPTELTCPACGVTNTYYAHDLHLLLKRAKA